MNAATDSLRWNLADLYQSPEDPRLADDLARSSDMADALAAKYRGRLALLKPAELAEALQAYEALMEVGYRPQLYASLLFSGQTNEERAQALLNRTRQATTDAFNTVKFVEIELKKLPEELFQSLITSAELSRYKHFLQSQRRFAPHTLSEAEEKLSEVKSLTGKAAFSQLYTEVSARIRIPVDIDGKRKEVTVAEARAMRSSHDRDLRKRATDGLMEAFEAQQHVLNFCFNTLFQDHALDVRQRGFQSVAEPTYLEDELLPETVERLMETTEAHYGLAQRYMRSKAKVLGLSDFSSHDVLAPLQSSEKKISFDEGRQLVLEAFGAFEPRFASIAKEFFEHRWIDALPRLGKRDGAFCSGMLPSLHPYVLLNYEGRLEDVSTLAHELGHGIHFYLSRRNSPLNFWATTPMAETASVFGELLLMRRLLDGEKDKAVRRSLLGLRIEDILATVFNQVSYTRWEQKAHARRGEGVAAAEDYAQLWMDERRRLYGDAVKLYPRDRWGWISIGHFVHYRFYCYSYAFGQLLVLALYQKYEEQGADFVPRYVELLSSGSSKTPQELAAAMGIDLADPGFWKKGFVILEKLLEEFEALV